MNTPLEMTSSLIKEKYPQSLYGYNFLNQEPGRTWLYRPDVQTSTQSFENRKDVTIQRKIKMPAVSPPISEISMGEEYGENEHGVPRLELNGKIKTFLCKQCSYVARTKFELWTHRRTGHLITEKHLTCHLCPFITEYKHHFNLHLRNHKGIKPFKCEHCDYSCVNKAMLNSHNKSHSNIYQYTCGDCNYISKYCHPFKKHLRKNNHQPGLVLNPDGSPNPLSIIDVYGVRRGSKVKRTRENEQEDIKEPISKKPRTDIPTPATLLPLPLQEFNTPTPPAFASPAYSFQQAMIYKNLSRLKNGELSTQTRSTNDQQAIGNSPSDMSGILDPSICNANIKNYHRDFALKFYTPPPSSDDEEYKSTAMSKYVETVLEDTGELEEEPKENNNMISNENFNCQYCSISFRDAVIYSMHMVYHGYKDPFACGMCGHVCKDKVSFFLHVAYTHLL